MRRTRVLIVDDHTLFAEALTLTLELEARIEVIGHAQTGREGIELAAAFVPDVVLMDLEMPGLHGIEATRDLLRVVPHAHVIVLSGSRDSALVAQALAAGASRYVTKDTPAIRLIDEVLEFGADDDDVVVPLIPRDAVFARGRSA